MSSRRPISHAARDQPRRIPLSHRRALVAHHTRLQPVAGIDGIRLHLAEDVAPVWHATEAALGLAGAPLPFWAFAWAGGLALARFVQEHPDEVAGRRVMDLATGSGLVAIVAALAGASSVTAADVDPFAEAAVGMNARANRVLIAFVGRDLLDGEPPDVDGGGTCRRVGCCNWPRTRSRRPPGSRTAQSSSRGSSRCQTKSRVARPAGLEPTTFRSAT